MVEGFLDHGCLQLRSAIVFNMRSTVNSPPSLVWSTILFKRKLQNYGRQNYWIKKKKERKKNVEKSITKRKDIMVIGWKTKIKKCHGKQNKEKSKRKAVRGRELAR